MKTDSRAENREKEVSWVDPGYFSGASRLHNTGRLLVQLIHPPKGHKTLPTKQGIILICITLGIGTAAFNTSQNILYIVLSLLLCSLLLSGILSWINFKGCQWRIRTGRHFRVDEYAPIYIDIHNQKKWLPTYSLQFDLRARREGLMHRLRLMERLDSQQSTELEWLYKPEQRGTNEIGLKGLISKFPFGFLEKSISDSYVKPIRVWPKRIQYRFDLNSSVNGTRYGFDKHQLGEGTELHKLRAYHEGDSIRQVHWKVSAKLGRLMVKETSKEVRMRYHLKILSSNYEWDETTFELMLSTAASLGEELFREDQFKSYEIDGRETTVITEINDLHCFLDRLAELEQTDSAMNTFSKSDSSTLQFKRGQGNHILILFNNHVVGEA